MKKVCVNIRDLEFSNGFLNMTPKAETKVKNKTDKLDLFKIQNLCFKGHSQQSEQTPTKWGKIFQIHMYDKDLRSRIEEFLQLKNNKTPKNLIAQQAKY